MRSTLSRYICVATLVCAVGGGALADESVPKRLELARTLLSSFSISPQSTSYSHRGYVRWKGDLFTPEYTAHTDCSGFINSLLERAGDPVIRRLSLVARKGRPRSQDYFRLIDAEDGFRRIQNLADVLPGDIIAVKYLLVAEGADTGHVMLVDTVPVRRKKDTDPIIDGTRQWEVAVIDSTRTAHGKTDTRVDKDGSKRDGVGRGVFRLYSDETGKPVGFSWSTLKSSRYFDGISKPFAIGRPVK